MLPKEGLFLDIGANIGIMSVTAARKFPQIQVHAFEPVISNADALNRIVSFFKLNNVTLHKVALGNQNGNIKMVMPVQNNVKFQGLSHVLHDSIKDNNDGEIYEVPIYRLDEYQPIYASNQRIVGIKMDVENFEAFVVKGGLKLIEKHQPTLYIELWDNDNRASCFKDLGLLGYLPYTLENEKLVLYDAQKHHNHNFFFVPKK
jgi:FkbM family methyltransferase